MERMGDWELHSEKGIFWVPLIQLDTTKLHTLYILHHLGQLQEDLKKLYITFV